MNFLANIGRATLTVLAHIGRLAQFTGQALAALVSPPIYTRLILGQIMRIGYYSLPVVGLTALSTGAVLGPDPDNLPDPTEEVNLDKISGRGVLLMRTFVDELTYNDRGNVVTMIKRRKPANSDALAYSET